jgi:hypothetical protein
MDLSIFILDEKFLQETAPLLFSGIAILDFHRALSVHIYIFPFPDKF